MPGKRLIPGTRIRRQHAVWQMGTVLRYDEPVGPTGERIDVPVDSYRVHLEGEQGVAILPRTAFEIVATPDDQERARRRQLELVPSPGLAAHVAPVQDFYADEVVRVARTLYYKVSEHETFSGPSAEQHVPWEAANAAARIQFLAFAQVAVDAYLDKPISWLVPPPGLKRRKRRTQGKTAVTGRV